MPRDRAGARARGLRRHRRRHLLPPPTSRATRASSPSASRRSPRRRASRFRYGRSIKRLEAHRGRIATVVLADAEGRDDRISADAYVVALGGYSPLLLRPLGVSLPVYPLKGYSITVPLEPGDEAPTVSLDDNLARLLATGRPAPRGGHGGGGGLQHRRQRCALPGDRAARLRDLPARRPAGAGGVLDRPAAGDAVERAGHRPHQARQPLREYRARDAQVDDGVRLEPRARRHRERPAARADFRFAGVPARPRNAPWSRSRRARVFSARQWRAAAARCATVPRQRSGRAVPRDGRHPAAGRAPPARRPCRARARNCRASSCRRTRRA